DRPRQVHHEHHAALEHTYQQQVAKRPVVGSDLLAHLAHLGLDGVVGDQDLVDVLVHLLLRPSSDRRFTVAPTALPSREVWRATRPPSGEMWRAARPPRPLVSAALRNEGVTEEASPPPPTAAYVARSLAAGGCTHTR